VVGDEGGVGEAVADYVGEEEEGGGGVGGGGGGGGDVGFDLEVLVGGVGS